MQTSYPLTMKKGVPGMLADSGFTDKISVAAEEALPFGVLAIRGSADGLGKLPASAEDVAKALGIVLKRLDIESSLTGVPQYPVKEMAPVIKRGRVYVQVETAVVAGQPVFARFATGIIDDTKVQKGAFRGNGDGVAQVATLTPTGANNTVYSMSIFDNMGKLLKSVSVTSDADGTATEIVTALKAALGTVEGITLSGTATLILTSSVAGKPFSVVSNGPGVIAIAATTPNTQSAAQVPTAIFAESADAGGIVAIDINLP